MSTIRCELEMSADGAVAVTLFDGCAMPEAIDLCNVLVRRSDVTRRITVRTPRLLDANEVSAAGGSSTVAPEPPEAGAPECNRQGGQVANGVSAGSVVYVPRETQVVDPTEQQAHGQGNHRDQTD